MKIRSAVSKQTRDNWMVDAGLFMSGVLAALSGVYFLVFVYGGYMGGRNPLSNSFLIFDRHTWNNLHTWTGILMIVIAAIHILVHWSWFVSMIRRTIKEMRGMVGHMNTRGRWNLVLNVLVAVSFTLTALSGIYFLFAPHGPGTSGSTFIFTRNTWDLIHTWAGVVLIEAAVIHFAIHWRWLVKVTAKLANSIRLTYGVISPGCEIVVEKQ